MNADPPLIDLGCTSDGFTKDSHFVGEAGIAYLFRR
jgi:hypothetical protein